MLVIVLVLVLAAFALLVLALVSTSMVWAWLSVAVSLIAAVLLFVDYLRRRRVALAARDRAEQAEYDDVADSGSGVGDASPSEPGETGPPDLPGLDDEPDDEPDEEQTDAADILAVSDSDLEVRVVDERPRYHLAACSWLAGRPTLGLPVREARELGFTPCSRCAPDRRLAALSRRGTRE